MSTISASTTSTTAYKVTADTTGTLVLQTGSTPTTAVTIDTSQRVGIGTSSPTTTLTLSQAAARIKTNSTGDNGSWSEWSSNNGAGNIFYSGMDNSTGTSFGVPYAGVMYHAGAYPLVFANNATERGRFDTGGRFLVGLNTAITSWGSGAAQQIQATASGVNYPGYSAYAFSASAGSAGMINLGHSRSATVGTLSTTQSGDVLGYLVFEGVNSSNALAGGGYISVTQTGAAGATYIPGALQFYTSSTSAGAAERARINSSGSFLVGTTSEMGGGGSDNTNGFGVQGGGGNNTYMVLQNKSDANMYLAKNTGYSSGIYAYFYVVGSAVGSISTNGSTTSYNTSSDYRLKENIAPMSGALAKVAALKPCTYTWKSDGSSGEGFIAHELAEVVPDAVTGEKDAVKEDGSIIPQGIDTSYLVATLTAAIQEQQAIIETLTNRITALEAK